MNKKGIGIVGIIIAVIVVAAIAGYFLYKPSAYTPPSTETRTESAASANIEAQEGQISVNIDDFAFNPSEIKIKAGSNVTWKNNNWAPHTITSDSGGKAELNSKQLAQGESYSHVFNTKGVFNYHCSIHRDMKGKVVVE